MEGSEMDQEVKERDSAALERGPKVVKAGGRYPIDARVVPGYADSTPRGRARKA